MFDAQQRFKKRILNDKKIIKSRKTKNDDDIDVPISSEMKEWLQDTLYRTDSDGYPVDLVSSVLTAPLDGELVYCPTSAVVNSKYTSSILPRAENEIISQKLLTERFESFDELPSLTLGDISMTEDNDFAMKVDYVSTAETSIPSNNSTNVRTYTSSQDKSFTQKLLKAIAPPGINEAVNRLNVLWLQRKAMLDKKEGKFDEAYKALEEAVNIHIGDSKSLYATGHHSLEDYKSAKLSEYTMSSDPTDLLNQIEVNYLVYDPKAHHKASRIQRFLHKRYVRRCNCQTILAKISRGFLARMKVGALKFRRLQCALLIQKRFRVHLIRIFWLATRIKSWYTSCKKREQYKLLLREYRLVRRIQRLYRGYCGRKIGNQYRLERDMTHKVHRACRGYITRKNRCYGIKLWHKLFNEKAVKIQLLVRRIQACRRSQLQLLKELAREHDRYSRERNIIDNTVKVEIDRVRLYMQSAAGKLHLGVIIEKLKGKDRQFAKIKHTLSHKEILAHDAMIAFELFDTDGSGEIDEDELANMLRELCIPMNQSDVHDLHRDMDQDGSGDIDFGEFLDWYTGEGSEGNDATLGDAVFKQVLRARALVMELSGITIRKRAERELLRSCTTWKAKDITATFRMTCPPKFQCCQCMKPFVLFTDFFLHFDQSGMCEVLGLKGLFYRKFWNLREWRRQRQCENEVMRHADEDPTIRYESMMACYADLALQQDSSMQAVLSRYSKAATIMYLEQMAPHLFAKNRKPVDDVVAVEAVKKDGESEEAGENEDKKSKKKKKEDDKELKKKGKEKEKEKEKEPSDEKGDVVVVQQPAGRTIGSMIREVITICNDKVISITLLKVIQDILGVKMPEDWSFKEDIELIEIEKWLYEIVDKSRVVTSKGPFVFTTNQKIRQDAALIGRIYVAAIRLMVTAAEAELIALIEFRLRRPRIIEFDDNELQRIELPGGTEKDYHEKRLKVVNRMSVVTKAMQRLLLVEIPGCCGYRSRNGFKHIQIGADGSLTPEALTKLLIYEAHTVASAKYSNRLNTPIGATQVSRWAKELWAKRRIALDAVGVGDTKQAQDAKIKYYYDLFAGVVGTEGINLLDLELVCDYFSLKNDENTEQNMAVDLRKGDKQLAANSDYNYFTFAAFNEWIGGDNYRKYVDYKKLLQNSVWNSLMFLCRLMYRVDSKVIIHSNYRILSRYELDLRSKSMKNLLLTETLNDAEKSKLPADEVENLSKAQASLKDEIAVIQDKLEEIKYVNEKSELLLLYRLAEDTAQAKCVSSFFSRKGIYNLATERHVIKAADSIIDAYGYIITPNAQFPFTAHFRLVLKQFFHKYFGWNVYRDLDAFLATQLSNLEKDNQVEKPLLYEVGWELALSILVYAFDTDCSGTFDEGEVRLLLDCSLCTLSEREILYNFPEVRLDSATIEKIVLYLAKKVRWRRGWLGPFGFSGGVSISKKNSVITSAMMLISLSRQIAREKAEVATTLARTGKLLTDDDEKTDLTLIYRSQMFAIRQVKYYLGTTQGDMKIKFKLLDIRKWWQFDVAEGNFCRSGIISYAYHVHSEWGGLLVTELPHLIKFLVQRFHFKITKEIIEMQDILKNIQSKDDLFWLSEEETVELLEPMIQSYVADGSIRHTLYKSYVSYSARLRSDSTVSMYSNARTQAVMIAMQFEDIYVSETNYRCSVLGTHSICITYLSILTHLLLPQ
jgi:hypothetical protein